MTGPLGTTTYKKIMINKYIPDGINIQFFAHDFLAFSLFLLIQFLCCIKVIP